MSVFDFVILSQISHIIEDKETSKICGLNNLDLLEVRLFAEEDIFKLILQNTVVWNQIKRKKSLYWRQGRG